MRILRNHFTLEFFQPFLASLSALVFVLVLGRGFVQMADFVFNKRVDVFLILQLLFFTLPFVMIFLIPVSVLIGTLLMFTKLSMDHEIIAIRSSGVGLMRVLKPLFFATVVIALSAFLLSDRIASISHYQYRKLLTQIGMESPAAILEEGTFIKKFKNFVIFVYEIDENTLKGIRIYQPQEGRPTRTIIAQKGELVSIPEKNAVKLRLYHGTSDEPDPKDPGKFYKLNFKTYDLPLNLSNVKDTTEVSKKPKDMSIRELRSEIKRLKEEGIIDIYSLSAEIHHKIALAFSSLVFLIVGTAISISNHRRQKRMSFAIGLACVAIYWILLLGGLTLAKKGMVHPLIALQTGNVLMGLFGIGMLIKQTRT